MPSQIKKTLFITIFSLILAAGLFSLLNRLPLARNIDRRVYDALLKARLKFLPTPPAIQDILLVTIDNETLNNMPGRWPYPRSDFAKVIANLQNAGARIIAFDFVFLGKSTPEEDALLRAAIAQKNNIVLAAAINEYGQIDLAGNPDLTKNASLGIITKLQDPDGINRSGLTYLVSEEQANQGFLSWEMQVLKMAKRINLSSFSSGKDLLTFENDSGEKWQVPVETDTKSFLINFRSHTPDFPRLSFYRALKGDFAPGLVKDKIVLVGLVSLLFQDLHNTPIGWLPGITLNANAFLTLYSHDFLKNAGQPIQLLLVAVGVIILALLASFFKTQAGLIFLTLGLFLFLLSSYLFLLAGYILHYSFFLIAFGFCPLLAKKICFFSQNLKARIHWT